MNVLTAIPVYNEAAHIEPVLREVERFADSILVVDDGSTDGTYDALQRFPNVQVVRHPRNRGYGAALATAFAHTIEHGYDGLVTLDCDGQHEPCRIPEIAAPLGQVDIVSGSRYFTVFDPAQVPPVERRRINIEVTRWLNECLHLNLTDAFCGFKAYHRRALERLDVTVDGYAMPIEIWVQAAALGLSVVEVPVPLIYLDASRAFGGSLDDPTIRLSHYRDVLRASVKRYGFELAGSCAE